MTGQTKKRYEQKGDISGSPFCLYFDRVEARARPSTAWRWGSGVAKATLYQQARTRTPTGSCANYMPTGTDLSVCTALPGAVPRDSFGFLATLDSGP
jgi:hypothetical protein